MHTHDPRFEDVYAELRRIAAARLAHEQPGQTLDATGLVHEAFLRLADRDFTDRNHLLAAASTVIRHILVDRARTRLTLKRGGHTSRIDLRHDVPVFDLPPGDLIDLDDALTALAAAYPEHAELVHHRFFGGLTVEAAGEVLGVSRATADRHWKFARAWLHSRLTSSENNENS